MNPPLPRGISGRSFMRFAEQHGYRYLRSSSSHVIFALERDGLHHICIPDKKELSVGTMSDLLKDMAVHLGIARAGLIVSLRDHR